MYWGSEAIELVQLPGTLLTSDPCNLSLVFLELVGISFSYFCLGSQ